MSYPGLEICDSGLFLAIDTFFYVGTASYSQLILDCFLEWKVIFLFMRKLTKP